MQRARAEREAQVLALASLLSQRREVLARARDVLGDWDLARFSRLDLHGLRGLGLTRQEALRVAGAFALGRQVELCRRPERPMLRRARDVFQQVIPQLRGLDREVFVVLLLDVQNRLLDQHLVSVGTLTSSLVHPREVFGPAIRKGAAGLLVVHNHPSGDPEPSQADRDVTRRLIRAGSLLGIPLLDHVVVGHDQFRSLRESMDFEREAGQWAGGRQAANAEGAGSVQNPAPP
ncbi:MAG: DNA repair protein RadC [Planctomycetota bacterium]